MFGLNSDPTTDASFGSLDYAIYLANGSIQIYESNNSVYTGGSYTTNDVFYITYDGITVRYYQNGTLLRSVARSIGSALYLDSSILTSALAFTNVSFGPMGEQGAQGTTGASAGITSYTNPADNRVITSVSSTTINAEANLTFDGSTLTVTGTLTETSSKKYKEDIKTLENALDTVLKLHGVSYTRKVDQVKEIGVIAEEVERILPEVIKYNEDGTPDSVSYSRLSAIFIEAFKQQQKQIELLKQEINLIK